MRFMKILGLLFTLLFTVELTYSQTLPEIKGETGDNRNITIPKELRGKYSLLCFASSTKAQKDLESWLDPVYQKYIAKTGIMDDMYDVNVFFVPILTGSNLQFAATMKKKFKENTQADLQPHVLFCSEDGKDILTSLDMQKSDVPYFLLLDKDAKIIYRTTGGYTEEKFDAIDDLIE